MMLVLYKSADVHCEVDRETSSPLRSWSRSGRRR